MYMLKLAKYHHLFIQQSHPIVDVFTRYETAWFYGTFKMCKVKEQVL